jgi:putative ABC transport system permease protein
MTDVRLAIRMMAKQPGMALLAVVALALGIGLTTTMFSIVNGAVLRGLPFPESDRIYHVAPFNVAEQDDVDSRAHTVAEFMRRQQAFEPLAAFRFATANVVGPDGIPERYRAAWVTANVFRLLKVAPVLGRDFRDEESRPGAAPVVMIGHKVWQERFKGAPDAIGQPLRVNGTVMTVVGVMPPKFAFPQSQDIWPAAVIDPSTPRSDSEPLYEMIGRLRQDVSPDQAAAQMATVWNQLSLEFPDRYEKGFTTETKTYIQEFMGSEIINTLLTMLGAVLGVLVIACANVANLVLARAADRSREIAVRTAVGASRWRVVRQMLMEVLVLAVAGALAGLAIAWAGVTLFNRAIVDTNPPFWIDIRIDRMVLLFVTAVTLLSAFVAGIVPALRASRSDLTTVLNDEGRGTSSLRMGRLSRGLVVVELSVSFGLLVVSALMIQSIVKIGRVDFGYAAADVWTGRILLPEEDYKDDERQRQFADALLARLDTIPGVESAALATGAPPGAPRYEIKFPGATYPDDRAYPEARGLTVSPDYFRVLRVGVLQGRAFDRRDRQDVDGAAIVNESFARRHFPQGALGQQFALARGEYQQWRTIVGVVPDLGMGQLDQGRVPESFYLALAQAPPSGLSILLDTSGDPLAVTGAVRRAILDIDPNLPVFNVNTVQQALDQTGWPFRVFGTLFTSFGLSALFLATVGLYGVMAFSVSRRTQEIGVRMAMGARARDVLRMVLRQGVWQVAAGTLLGVGLGALLASALQLLFFNVSPYDPMTFVVIGLILSATGVGACLVPARRAAGVDPMTALRYQ